jgi:hypothetical protein
MAVSRRHLLRLGQACLAASAMPLKALTNDTISGDPLLSMKWQEWMPLLGSSFNTQTASGKSVWLTLGGVQDMTPNVSGSTRISALWRSEPLIQTFSLKFTGVGEELPQDTYQFENATLGRISLFIVPGGSKNYTAIISHLTGPLPASYSIPTRRKAKVYGPAAAENRPRRESGTQAAQIDAVKD